MAENQKKGLKGIYKFLIIASIIVLAIVTCPSEEAHMKAIKEAVRKENIKEGNPFGGLFGSILTMGVTTTDYIIFSVGTINHGDGKSETVSIGAFGKVFVLM